jgi:hypothetical protein
LLFAHLKKNTAILTVSTALAAKTGRLEVFSAVEMVKLALVECASSKRESVGCDGILAVPE